jgi:hypothetical protein
MGGVCACVLWAEAAVWGLWCEVVFGYCVCAVTRVSVSVCLQRDGRTALCVASANGKEEVVKVLVSSGAAVNAATV